MAERDDTPGTDQDEVDEDARPSEQEPDPAAIDEPTRGGKQEASETAWMMKEGVTVGVISILALVVLALALMQATGLVDFLSPVVGSEGGQWTAVAVVALLTVGVFAWSRWGV